MSADQKIFFLGFNKTGTTTFHATFAKHGYKSRHDRWAIWTRERNVDLLDQFQVFSDNGNQADYVWLRAQYPEACFVLNSRNLRSWLVSRFNHVERVKGRGLRKLARSGQAEISRAAFLDDFLALRGWSNNTKEDVVSWVLDRNTHAREVSEFFEDDLLHITIEMEDEQLVRALNEHCGLSLTELQSKRIASDRPNYRHRVEVVESVIQEFGISDEECDMTFIPRDLKLPAWSGGEATVSDVGGQT